MRDVTPSFRSVSSYSLRRKGSSSQYGMAVPPSVTSIAPSSGYCPPGPPPFSLRVVVGLAPADQPRRLFAGAEMPREPFAAIGRGGDHADRLIVLPVDLIALAVLPRRHPDRPRLGIGVALAFDAD